MSKLWKAIILLITIFVFSSQSVEAKDFFVNAEADYILQSDGSTQIVYRVEIENATTNSYAQDFRLNLSGLSPENVVAIEGEQYLETEVSSNLDSTIIKVDFLDKVVGEGQDREFEVRFTDSSLMSRAGNVWEVVIPKISNQDVFDSFLLRLIVPEELGKPAYVTPEPISQLQSENGLRYYFDKNTLKDAVTAAFGDLQVFSFDITYHLENPLVKSANVEVALPPDTSYQDVYYEKISPFPDHIYSDEEGNWMARFKLMPRERLDVKAQGYVELFNDPKKRTSVTQEFLEKNLQSSEYWQTEDPKIIALAQELKTPENIYNYVVSTLDYDYQKVSPTSERLGALEALAYPDNAICTEFTDLFIALSRAAGIPAREINGYAYTENPNLQPLSLVADVLHAWPEYWDKDRQAWIPIDPTWGNTTGGADYFSKLDLRHITFVKHGFSATKPFPPGSYKLGSNPQKDVFVSFSKLPNFDDPPIEVGLVQLNSIPFRPVSVEASILNKGPRAIYDQPIEIYFDGQLAYSYQEKLLLPFTKKDIEIKVPYGILGQNMPEIVKLKYAGLDQSLVLNKYAKTKIDVIFVFLIVGVITTLGYLYVKPPKKLISKIFKK